VGEIERKIARQVEFRGQGRPSKTNKSGLFSWLVPGLIHRYSDRCLAMVTGTCAAYCRHCNRKHRWKELETKHSRKSLQMMVDYVSRTKQIREAILSGGDPLILNIEALGWFLHSLKSIPHVEAIRIGSRIPVVVPCSV